MGGERRYKKTTKGRHTGRGNNDNENYTPTQPGSEAATASYYSEPEILFAFGGKESVATAVIYTKLALAAFEQGYLLVLIHWCRRPWGSQYSPRE